LITLPIFTKFIVTSKSYVVHFQSLRSSLPKFT